jgi:hypothetical protein
MTAKEIQKRNAKANQLKVIQTENGQLFVESSQGKILYNVTIKDDERMCTCGDFSRNSKQDPTFRCKHILAAENSAQDEIEAAEFLEKNTPRLNKDFIKNIKGKDFVLYAGVLDLAHQKGLLRLEVEIIQLPTKENGNEAICRAVAEGKNGELFADVGDANPHNCAEMISKHILRMSSTRAAGRALRNYTNISMACIEELESMDDVIGAKPSAAPRRKAEAPGKKMATVTKLNVAEEQSEDSVVPDDKKVPNVPQVTVEEKPPEISEGPKPSISEAQKRAIHNLSRRRGISIEALNISVMEDYGVPLENLSATDASAFIRNLQQAA